jgi:hypothetical protein
LLPVLLTLVVACMADRLAGSSVKAVRE